jgi:nucleoside-diphosphate-sugar epimerase
VTGANGFVGVNIVRRLAQKGAHVVALARRPPDSETLRYLQDLAARIVWVEIDVRDRQGLTAALRDHAIDRVVHGAAMTPTPEVERTQTATVVDINFGGTLNALEAARESGAGHFVFISSSGLYGAPDGDPRQPRTEHDPLKIVGLYAICKQAGEHLCRRYSELHGLTTAVGRLGSAYGPMEWASKSRESMSLVYDAAHRALAGEHMAVWGSDRVRDFCYVADVAEAFARLALAEELHWPLYNVATDQAITVRDVLDELVRLCPGFTWSEVADPEQADVTLPPTSARAPHELSRLREDVDFSPQYDLSRGLKAYLDWLRSGWMHL